MPIIMSEVVESHNWRTGDRPSVMLVHTLDGTASDTAAKAPAAYEGYARDQISLEPEWVDSGANTGRWNVVTYIPPDGQEPATGESVCSFDTGGGTQHVAQALGTVSRSVPAGKTAADFKGAIGVTDDAVEGVDITVPSFSYPTQRHGHARLPRHAIRPNRQDQQRRLQGPGGRGVPVPRRQRQQARGGRLRDYLRLRYQEPRTRGSRGMDHAPRSPPAERRTLSASCSRSGLTGQAAFPPPRDLRNAPNAYSHRHDQNHLRNCCRRAHTHTHTHTHTVAALP